MIVRTAGDVLHLITQPDHAALARRIMDHWVADGLAASPRRASILRAIEEHDHGWLDVDASPIVDLATGRIADFITAPLHVRQEIWPRAVLRLSGDPWAAALVAQHAIHVYARYTDDPDWQAFFARMAELRTESLDRTGRSLELLLEDYRFLRIGDLISLAFCNAWTDEHQHGPHTIRFRDPEITISPDPFGGRRFPIDVPARVLPNRAFGDDADAGSEWRESRRASIAGIAAGAVAAGSAEFRSRAD